MDPQLRKAYLVGGVLGFAAGVAVLTISILLFPGLILDLIGPQDEEERPPVVVSNGSVKFDAGSTLPPDKRGDFKAVTGATVYRHAGDVEADDKTVTSMDVLVEGTNSPACQSEITNLTELTIVTTKGSILVNLRPRGGAGSKVDVAFTFLSNATKPRKARLRLLDQDLQGVEFKVGTTTHQCTFDRDEDERQIRIQAR
jgi:hypothetical protein